MKHRACALFLALALAGCQGESARPEPTGKGGVRMINALDDAPQVSFFIEERRLETVATQRASSVSRWDDFEYNFNFEADVLGQLQATRFATRTLKVERDREYALILTDELDNPTITVWETAERAFDGTEVVFEARFAHFASAGRADFYFLPASEAPAVDNALGTLESGEFLAPIDIDEGDYVLTITAAGDPSTVLFESTETAYSRAIVSTFALTDGRSADSAPYTVQRIPNSGGGTTLRDVRFGPTVRLFQASLTLADADVYRSEDLANVIVADHRFGDITSDISIDPGTTEFTYTAAGNASVTLLETDIDATNGRRYNLVVSGDDSDRSGVSYLIDRSPVASEARLLVFQASANHPDVDVYAVGRDAGFTGDGRTLSGLDLGAFNTIAFGPRELDLYVTTAGEDTVLAGPLPLDLQLGDFVELIVLDTVDPATAELRVVPAP